MGSNTIRTFFHWTHIDNLPSIEANGLDPEYSTGDMYAVWFCQYGMIGWAKGHVAKKHKWKESEMVLLRFDISERHAYRTKWQGVYYSPRTVDPAILDIRVGHHDFKPLSEYMDTPMMPVDLPPYA